MQEAFQCSIGYYSGSRFDDVFFRLYVGIAKAQGQFAFGKNNPIISSSRRKWDGCDIAKCIPG
jgi:hypothetical protein